jgi:hypothetical protein
MAITKSNALRLLKQRSHERGFQFSNCDLLPVESAIIPHQISAMFSKSIPPSKEKLLTVTGVTK